MNQSASTQPAKPPARPWARRLLLVFVLGPLPISALVVCVHSIPALESALQGKEALPPICGGFGALWGRSAGILRRSLLRSLIGLNLGALVGGAFGLLISEPGSRNISQVILLLATAGAILGMAMNARLGNLIESLAWGAFAGAMAFGAMALSVWLVTKVFDPNLLGWTVMCLVPFGLGLWLFFLLVGQREETPGQKPPI